MTETQSLIHRIYDMAFGGLVMSLIHLAIFCYTAKQTQHCDDGHVGFRIEQCMGEAR